MGQLPAPPSFDLAAADDRELSRFRARLDRLSFTGPAMRDLLGEWPKPFTAGSTMERAYRFLLADKPDLFSLARLFLSGQPIPTPTAQALFDSDILSYLEAVGALAVTAGQVRSRFLLFPIEDLYLITDGIPGNLDARKAVFALEWEQNLLANALVRDHAGCGLDLCTGSGILALLLSGYCDEVVAIDINPRAAALAQFNARLNGRRNIAVLCGDVYEPLREQTFDVICANPPYNPAADIPDDDRILSIHGGGSGEEVLCRILGGLSARLSESGLAQIVTRLYLSDEVSYSDRLGRFIDRGMFNGCVISLPYRQIFTLSNLAFSAWSVPPERAPGVWETLLRTGISRESFGLLNLRRSAEGGNFVEHTHVRSEMTRDIDRSNLVREALGLSRNG